MYFRVLLEMIKFQVLVILYSFQNKYKSFSMFFLRRPVLRLIFGSLAIAIVTLCNINRWNYTAGGTTGGDIRALRLNAPL